jgi:hypothetical protein
VRRDSGGVGNEREERDWDVCECGNREVPATSTCSWWTSRAARDAYWQLGSSELPSPRPRLIMFEHKHLTAPVRFMINSSLESLGYQFVGGVAGGVGGVVTARHGDWLWQRRGSEIPN